MTPGSPRNRPRVGAAVLAAVMLLVGCNGGETPAPGAVETTVVAGSPGPPSDEPVPTPGVDEQFEWFLSVLGGRAIGSGDDSDRFSPSFREQHLDDLRPLLDRLQRSGPYSVTERTSRDPDTIEAVARGADGSTVRVLLGVDEGGLISKLRLIPEAPPRLSAPPADFEEAAERLADLGTVRMVVAEVTGEGCGPMFERAADEPGPIAGVSKLYILGAMAYEIRDGRIGWDEELEITDQVRSVPPGTLQERPAGSTVTVREAALAMVALSDNTAADLLLDRIGRERVEAAMALLGNDSVGMTLPFLTTLEHVALKIGPAAGLRTQYVGAGIERRRAILRTLEDLRPEDIPLPGFTEPVAVDSIEWFASPIDLCELHVALAGLAGEPGLEPLGEILTANPGGPDPASGWAEQSFKGGAEPGVTAMTWRLTDPGRGTYVVAGSVVDPDEALDETTAALLFLAVRDLVAG